MALFFYVRTLFTREFPGKSTISALRKEVTKLDGELGDLEERFTRFQKRRNMQDARETKTAQKDLLAEAAELVANNSAPAGQSTHPSGAESPKADLYRRAFKH